jgi:hypothetical protein
MATAKKLPHYNVLIATPGRSMENEYVVSLMNTVEVLNKKKISFKFINRYAAVVGMAREGTLMNSDFMDITNGKPLLGEATYDKIIWIDSDISWTAEDFLKLYQAEDDIVSGIYLSDRGTPMFSGSAKPKNEYLNTTEKFEVKYVGFGFLAIKSGVFENLSRPWFEPTFKKVTDENGKEYLIPQGEDYSLCAKATRAGYKIFVDPTVNVGHHKKVGIFVPASQ